MAQPGLLSMHGQVRSLMNVGKRRNPLCVTSASWGYILPMGDLMRTNIEIDDELMQRAMRCTGARTKRAVVETALRLLVRTHSQTGILRGKVRWHGDLE